MKRIILLAILLILLNGCKNIHIGGTGQIGDVTAGGGVNIPVPKSK